VRYLQYLAKYREYQRFDTSIEEVSVYCGATIPTSIVTWPYQFRYWSVWNSIFVLLTTTGHCASVRDSNEKARHIKACQACSKYIFFKCWWGFQTLRDTGEIYLSLLCLPVDQCVICTSGIVVVSRYLIPETVSLSWHQFQVSRKTNTSVHCE